MYATDELLDNPDLFIQIATKWKEERKKNNLLVLENKKKTERIEHLELHADFSKEFLKSEKETLISIKNYLPRKSFLLEIDFKTFFILSLPLR